MPRLRLKVITKGSTGHLAQQRALLNPWINLPEDWRDHLGFVYRIDCPSTGRYYIGKKLFFAATARRGSKKLTKESDWREYWGSCKELVADRKILGNDNFTRTILYVGDTKTDITYTEIMLQIEADVFHDPLAYNKIINCRLYSHKEVFNPAKHKRL